MHWALLATYVFLFHVPSISYTVLAYEVGSFEYYTTNPNRISADLMLGPTDENGNRMQRENCVLYVNRYQHREEYDPRDPNYPKNRAVQFTELMNDETNNILGFHTIYDIYDSSKAFDEHSGPMYEATVSGNLRNWFRLTSAQFAYFCAGLVYLVIEEAQIFDDSIWVTHELPALWDNPAITQIIEIRPTDIGRAVADRTTIIPYYPYRGGLPPHSPLSNVDNSSTNPLGINIDLDLQEIPRRVVNVADIILVLYELYNTFVPLWQVLAIAYICQNGLLWSVLATH
ncbi:hypothetical protein BT96DRAFT_994199 [Gymnopus androsaceus JB14]|uniref:Uncharacterized protein n=1 Tax=Gymnopus androsaceus JB14 TaxID=1447944 RepID=A0A6A4HLB8_9AGAR|nr:hypothetical protein BT96DRAFT_994199 [Gymnopus androsaceus JB14]